MMMVRSVDRIMVMMEVVVERIISVERSVSEYRIEPRVPPDGSEVRVVSPAAPPRVPVIVEPSVPAIVAEEIAPAPAYAQVCPVRIVVISPIVKRGVVKIKLVDCPVFRKEAVRDSYQRRILYKSELCVFSCRYGKGVRAASGTYKIYVGFVGLLRKLCKIAVVIFQRGFITVIEPVLVFHVRVCRI